MSIVETVQAGAGTAADAVADPRSTPGADAARDRRSTLLGRRRSGVLCHISSLPAPYGIGDLGAPARRFVQYLRDAGQSVWQVLPLGPPGAGGSPYQATSAFAGHPWLISLEDLVADSWLDPIWMGPADDLAWPWQYKMWRLGKAFERFNERGGAPGFDRFRERERFWLEDFALYSAIKDEQAGAAWLDWPAPLRNREEAALREARERFATRIRFHEFVQWVFRTQWDRLRAFAGGAQVQLLGDAPIFAALDSAETWARRGMFLVDEAGQPSEVAGVPPDYFSEDGQLWGNPLYDWQAMRADGFDWWLHRLEHLFSLYDAVRLDHFIGFHRAWAVPAAASTAKEGRWLLTPGDELFSAARARFGALPIVAEDLGFLTDEVRALRDHFGFPGMKVLQFAFSGGAESDHLPHSYPARSVVYTGTHDNDTVVGWWKRKPHPDRPEEKAEIQASREFVRRYLDTRGREIHWDFIRAALASVSDTAVIPLQDLLGLGSESRMNQPGLTEGNWAWRFEDGDLKESIADRLRELSETYGRG